ncbi:MAG TPA: S46 family peptidase [Vulgatibacter sp.]|nr:S46 family peptidase [Vulgatibacter sp.]
MKRLSLLAAATLAASPALADEGMWTYDNFPSAEVQAKYGFGPDQAWLDHVRLSSVRLANGCSGSFVSPTGLVLTNHHCVHSCVEQLSTAKRDYVQKGFYARTTREERVCPAAEINQLRRIEDVTDRIAQATKGLEGKAFAQAQRAEMSKLEQACADSPDKRCDIVTLYNGGRYHLYEYKRYQDVRLVFVPELATAFFGGDPDNFMFPRYNLDVAFLRVYEHGKPANLQNWLAWSSGGAQEGDLAFTSGHPGRTDRQLTVSQLVSQRDVALPRRLIYLSELRGMLGEFQRRGPEQRRIANTLLFYVENSVKALKGMREALVEAPLLEGKVAEEEKLRAWVTADPTREAAYGAAWKAIEDAQVAYRSQHDEYVYVEGSGRAPWGFQSDLFAIARTLVRAAEERTRPNEERLREFGEANLPAVEQRLFSGAPIHPELEKARLTFSLTKLREALGADHPTVKNVLGKESPESLAKKVVDGSRLRDPKVRRALYDGGAAAIAASKDPMIELARQVDPDARRIRAAYEESVDAITRKNGELIARARFEAYGTSVYPDATFTLRLSYGQVKGWEQDGRTIAPITTVSGAFERATGKDPYVLPASWWKARDALNPRTPMNFVTTNDIVGGNSGSPVVNRNAEVIGLIFDGNLPSLGGDYGFDPEVNRAVAVHSEAILAALRTIYSAERLVEELKPPATADGR